MAKMLNTSPEVSVIICTYALERWDDLLAAVSSIQRQTASSYEIIIVVDHNPALLEKARAAISDARVVENSQVKGLSGARNSGLAAAAGQLMAFLDDDATAEPDWLSVLCGLCNQPRTLGAGGKVEPNWLGTRPAWFPEEFGWVLGYSYLGMPQVNARVRNLFGGNMCIRREVFEAIGGFRTEIGRINKNPLGAEETEFCIRALQRWPESSFIYEPRTSIHHNTPSSRTNWAYFRRRCYSEGLSKALVSKFVGAKDGLRTERAYTFRVLPKGVVKGIFEAVFQHDLYGLARAGAILAGLGFTTAGFLAGSISKQVERLKFSLRRRSRLLKADL